MIIITSDHGDYLGDHWMGEKDLFHAPSVKVPLIIFDPRKDADATRGTACDALVEIIDITATIIDASGGEVPDHIVEGRSLMPYIEGQAPPNPRDYAISEYDYSQHPVASALGTQPRDARLFMVATHDWKLIHAVSCLAIHHSRHALLRSVAAYVPQWLGICRPLARRPCSGLLHSAGELLHTP